MFSVVEANAEHLQSWDNLVEQAINGTIFHRLDFLSYHGERFRSSERHLLVLKGNSPWAQISITVQTNEGVKIAKSPYGGSYGGFVFQKLPSYQEGSTIVSLLIDYLKGKDIDRFIITSSIACCSKYPLDVFYFNLLEAGFKSINRDISTVFCFGGAGSVEDEVSGRARRMARKAKKAGICIEQKGRLNDFWQVMETTFAKHGTRPTHTFEEFELLMDLFPVRVYVDVAYMNNIPVAGLGYFVVNSQVINSFYLCQDPDYQQYQALSLLILNALEQCANNGYRFFDFGTSSVNMLARENIFAFKENFTKVGMFRETFEWIR